MRSFARPLDALPAEPKALLEHGGCARARLEGWSNRMGHADNRVTGVVEPPRPEDIVPAPAAATAEGAAAVDRGRAAIARGEVAFVVLAGGMATRMGGVVKALVEVLPGLTFLGYRVREIDQLLSRYGGRVPLWIMTSFATNAAIEEAIAPYREGREVATFQQDVSLRLTPEGTLFRGEDHQPSLHATGHGDLPDALRRSGLLDAFIARGGRALWIANIDNLGASVDPALLGWHLGHGAPLSVELVDKVGTDRGGIPARLDGRPVVLEEFRLPKGFDANKVRTFNTNTFLVDARALRDCKPQWTYFEVKKKVGDKDVVQFERLLGELTSWLDTRFVKVPRDGLATRFLPVKDGPELEARRGELTSVAKDRGVLP
ncbi:MAG: UTP--glucose-1-phosphate uridylyltransferase [Polyangiales bacterium]